LEKIIGTPVSRAARATATSASRWASSSTPTGASRNGESSLRPNSSTDASGCAAPRSIRGTIRCRANAARFSRTVSSVPAPALM
jgi:hypothetical protein